MVKQFVGALIFPTFASRLGEGETLKSVQQGKESGIYFKINIAGEEKIATFAARFGRNGKPSEEGILK